MAASLKGAAMARVAVVGVGAIGAALAGFLETAGGHTITLCTRRPLNALTVKMPEGMVRVHARNLTDSTHAEPVDWVLVATKVYDSESTAHWFPALCAEGARVAIVQNGVEHREHFQTYVSAGRLLPVVIDCPVERTEDGDVRVRGAARMLVEEGQLGQDFADLFAGTKVASSRANVELTGDFITAMWWKLCVNSVGALSALALKPCSVLWGEAMSRVLVKMADESAAVARAEGARLSDSLGEEVLAHYKKYPADSVNSLLADRLAGRRMEWDARNAVIVRKGEKHGIATPLNRMAAALLEAAEGAAL
jgi:2-dehydropantoate 2-reductase